jgi:hypothetical protein
MFPMPTDSSKKPPRPPASASLAAERDEVSELQALEHQLEALEFDTELRWVGPPESASSQSAQAEAYRELEAWLDLQVRGVDEPRCREWIRVSFQP